MARIVPIKNDDLRSLIALEGRPVNLSVDLEGNGSSLQATGTTSANLSYTITDISSDTNAIITLDIPDTNLQVGDSITISDATGGGYTAVNGNRQIVSVISDTKFSINVDSSGFAGTYDTLNPATLAFSHINPTYSSISTSSIDIDVGRAVAVTSITITSNVKGRVSGVIAQNLIGDWIGLSNQDEFSLAIGEGGVATLNLDGLVLGSGAGVSLRFTPYPETGQTDPDIGMHINGIEFTADFNFNAKKKLLYCGDSIAWSLVGSWRPQDMGYNYSGNRRETNSPYPDYFGDELAAFRLVNALRSQADPESIRLVNKGFGGSKLATDQWFASRSGMYTIDWNMMVMQAGVNDAIDVQTPLRQLTMGQRIKDMVEKRNNDGRADYPMVFCTPPSVDDKFDGLNSRVCLDVRPPVAGTNELYSSIPESFSAKCTRSGLRLELTQGSNIATLYDSNTVGSFVTEVELIDGGNGYNQVVEKQTTSTNGSGVGLTLDVTVNQNSQITSISINDAGSGYVIGEIVTINQGGTANTSATARVTNVGNTVNTTSGSGSFKVILDGVEYTLTTAGNTPTFTLVGSTYHGTFGINQDPTGRLAIADIPHIIDLPTSGDRWVKIQGDGRDNIFFEGGASGEVYRIDLTTQVNLVTGGNTSQYPRFTTLEPLIDPSDSDLFNGFIETPANTSLFVKCVSVNNEYEEIDRAKLVGTILPQGADKFDTLDGELNHFIAGVSNGRTKIVGPNIEGITNPDLPDSFYTSVVSIGVDNITGSRGFSQINMGADSGLDVDELNLPPASVIENSDVWVKLTGFTNASEEGTAHGSRKSWADVNGFYKIINYTTTYLSGINKTVLGTIDINLDARNSKTTYFTHDGVITTATGNASYFKQGNLDADENIIEQVQIINTRPYIAQFEGSSDNDDTNCSYFEAGESKYDGYKVVVQLTDGKTEFNLEAGNAICFSVYQQGNVIYMNEIISGTITNVGKVVGASSVANFWSTNQSTNEAGLTRLKTVRKIITDTVQLPALANDNVHLVDLYEIDDLKNTTETTAGRLIYGEDNYKEADSSTGLDSTLKVGDLIEDPIFKSSGDSGITERVMGKRLHRSPKGHEEIYSRLYSVISGITIPN